MARHSLRVCVVIVLVAAIGESAQKLMLTLKSQLSEDALLKVHLDTADCISHLHEIFGLNFPRCGTALKSIERLGFLLAEEFRLSSFGHD